MYSAVIHNFIFYQIILIISPATCFGPNAGPSSGWVLNRWRIQLIMLYQLHTPPDNALSILQSTCSKISLKRHYIWAETCSWNYNLMKYKVVYDCIIYIYFLYYILAYIQHNGDVSFEKKKVVVYSYNQSLLLHNLFYVMDSIYMMCFIISPTFILNSSVLQVPSISTWFTQSP